MKRPFTQEEKERLSESIKRGYASGRTAWAKGRKFDAEHKKKLSETRIKNDITGEKHPRWVLDRSKLSKTNKSGVEYRHNPLHREWSNQVKKRDNHTCKMKNSECCGKIETHHILSWMCYPELRYQLNNGITLCHFHHPRGKKMEESMRQFFIEIVAVHGN